MHHDSPIKDRTSGIKGDRAPYDVTSCQLFAHDVDESEPSNQDQTGELREIMGSWSTIIKRSGPLICLHRIERSAIFSDFFYKTVFFLFL